MRRDKARCWIQATTTTTTTSGLPITILHSFLLLLYKLRVLSNKRLLESLLVFVLTVVEFLFVVHNKRWDEESLQRNDPQGTPLKCDCSNHNNNTTMPRSAQPCLSRISLTFLYRLRSLIDPAMAAVLQEMHNRMYPPLQRTSTRKCLNTSWVHKEFDGVDSATLPWHFVAVQKWPRVTTITTAM